MKIEPDILLGMIEKMQPFMDYEDQVFVHIEVEKPDVTDPIEQLPVDTTQFKQWIRFHLIRHGMKELPTDKTVENVIGMIKGRAYVRPRQDANLVPTKLLTKRPLVRALMALAKQGHILADPTSILDQLNAIARRLELKPSEGWPSSEDALGKQLTAVKPTMAKLGVLCRGLPG